MVDLKNIHAELIDKEDALLLLVDIQKSMLSPCIDAEKIQRHAAVLIDIAQILGMPIIFTEQNALKLGKFLPELTDKVSDPMVLSKLEFGCFENRAIHDAIEKSGRKTIIIGGIETHICIFQTGLQGLQLGYRIHIIGDAVSSPSQSNRETALRRLERSGAVLSSTEMVIFELLRRAGTPEFRQMLPIIKGLI